MKPTREDVVKAYELLLGRFPEAEQAIQDHINGASSTVQLVRNIVGSEEFSRRIGIVPSPFHHFNASVDVRGIIESHANPRRVARQGHIVNFLGVAMPVEVMPTLNLSGGHLDPLPIPANYHADMAEWAAALRAVDLARDRFVMLELGCGWGCWMNNTGVAAKARGLGIKVIGIEGDEAYLDFARATLATNGIAKDEYVLLRGIAAARAGYALFPRRETDTWGLEPVFGVSETESEAAVRSGRFDRLPMVPLAEAFAGEPSVDLVHMDIQGGEADLVADSLDVLGGKVAYLVIGTHSRSIEGRLIDQLGAAGWLLEIERPAIFRIMEGKLVTTVDGVQGWRNPRIRA